MEKSIDEIVDLIEKRPTDILAMGRTMMASDRTYLGFIRTSIGFLAGGIGIVMYIDHPFLVTLGILLILFSIYILILGYRKHMRMKRILSRAYDTFMLSVKSDTGNSPES